MTSEQWLRQSEHDPEQVFVAATSKDCWGFTKKFSWKTKAVLSVTTTGLRLSFNRLDTTMLPENSVTGASAGILDLSVERYTMLLSATFSKKSLLFTITKR